mmetsp:Transcript_25663/g.41908  ORF Transcript_25663/g.41908 Transcript_25663/m.41908 type:complete len:459 (-) Transcript_25663:262-1638(-)|eukprot:CAMPEP_0202705096 /NCGR_PEP_ID=MMETSP1385-20130828/17693_1 /ASSEMBLY_ACC=CAM_ASM_000861 /TAXON_ID=933848 /ORGANISM="Elphidium margaritaceum" /LENGTH=458 /DNA_ID=CAMNT_0049363257 /DNA_START=15 /DNA_END=1391 /DNA_ORIENTATION=-
MTNAKAPEALEYWLISIPNQGNQEQALKQLKSNVESTRIGEQHALSKLPVTRLKVGTLDKLIALSDDLGRVDAFGKNVVQKLHRTYAELDSINNNANSSSINSSSSADQLLSVYNKTIRGYITNFLWDEGHFNPRQQLRELVQSINGNMLRTAESLRKWSASLSEVQNALTALERKKTGSLLNKSLAEYISHEDWYQGEYITSVLVVVPNAKRAEFDASYEFFEDTSAHKAYYDMLQQKRQQHEAEQQQQDQKGDAAVAVGVDDDHHHHDLSAMETEMNKLAAAQCRVVVPTSAKFLTKDNDFSLYRVLLLKRGYAWFKYVAMKHGYAVRDFDISELAESNDEKNKAEFEKKAASQKKKLMLFCKNTFSETFANWMHLKIIRTFVESVLRFGLPVDFSISVIRPQRGKEKYLLDTLVKRYNFLLDKLVQEKAKDSEIDYSGQENDFYPFIYVDVKVEL